MKSICLESTCVALALALNTAAFAQTSAPSATTVSRTAQQQRTADQQVTITGCIQREADYRRAHDAGRGGAAGTGVGAANEFVVINATVSSSRSAGTTGATARQSTGTAYELTGANEGQAGQYVGQRVEISGKLKAAEVDTAGRPTGGATAGKPPEGVDVAGQDLRLRELEVLSIRRVAGACSAQ